MKSFAVVSILASAVALVHAAPSSPLIPAGISDGCSKFLSDFNNDTSLQACTAPLISATSQFVGANATANPSSDAVKSSLDSLCSNASSCPDATIRSKLADFYTSCTAELTSSKNNDVLALYDVLYALIPFTQAVCAKDDSGAYCVGQVSAQVPASSLYTSVEDGTQTILKPNVNAFSTNNIAFLLLQTTTPQAKLCTACARAVLTAFVSWESGCPYAPGLGQSEILSGQTTLYTTVTSSCGATFLSGAVQAAGGLSGGILNDSSDAKRTVVGTVGAIVGALAVAAAVL